MNSEDILNSIRGDCDGCPEKYCTERNWHQLAWFLCREPDKPKHPGSESFDNKIGYVSKVK